MMKNKKIIYSVGFVLIFIISIVSYMIYTFQKQKVLEINCIAPVTDFAFPVGEVSESLSNELIPPKSARLIVTLPEEYSGAIYLTYYSGSIWTSGAVKIDKQINYNSIIRYDLRTNELFEYKTVDNLLISDIELERPLISSGDSLWTIIYPDIGSTPTAFVKYDKKTDRFITVPYSGEYFVNQAEIIGKKFGRYFFSGITGSSDGNLWLTDAYNLYEFDQETGEILPRLSVDSDVYLSSPVFDNEGNIWMLDKGQGRIAKYNLNSEEVSYFTGNFIDGFTEKDFRGANTYFDSQGRLWVSDIGWLDTEAQNFLGEPLWYKIVRSPVFITYPDRAENKYFWSKPKIELESNDNMIWFRTLQSLVRLNSDTGEWCKVSSGTTFVTKDSNDEVWILYGTQLYKYD
jgi:hypothetical protein